MKNYFNCIGVPIVWVGSGHKTYVIDKFAIPTLHCILGPCNKLYHTLEENCPAVERLSKKLGIVRDPFNNKDYNGNYCEKIMNNLESLKGSLLFFSLWQKWKFHQWFCFKVFFKKSFFACNLLKNIFYEKNTVSLKM